MLTIFLARDFFDFPLIIYALYSIKCSPEVPETLSLTKLIKTSYLVDMLDKNDDPLREECCGIGNSTETLPFNFPETKRRPFYPDFDDSFALLPLFEIRPQNGVINNLFEKQEHLNMIKYIKDHNRNENNDKYEFGRPFDSGVVKSFFYKNEDIATDKSGIIRSGCFFFNDRFSNTIKLYIAVSSGGKLVEDDGGRCTGLFNSHKNCTVLRKNEYRSAVLRDSKFELKLNLSKLLDEIKKDLCLIDEEGTPLKFSLTPSVDISSTSQNLELTVLLNFKEARGDGELIYEIHKQYENEALKDMHLILTPIDENSRKYLEKHENINS
ncbi:hypothetical protein CDIK_2396 [Cucumispora dikerogammari]|nr:hypothetical protein CDIK_2396 [Cucumispora dikerogammari]